MRSTFLKKILAAFISVLIISQGTSTYKASFSYDIFSRYATMGAFENIFIGVVNEVANTYVRAHNLGLEVLDSYGLPLPNIILHHSLRYSNIVNLSVTPIYNIKGYLPIGQNVIIEETVPTDEIFWSTDPRGIGAGRELLTVGGVYLIHANKLNAYDSEIVLWAGNTYLSVRPLDVDIGNLNRENVYSVFGATIDKYKEIYANQILPFWILQRESLICRTPGSCFSF